MASSKTAAVPPTRRTDPSAPPPGTIGIVSGDLARFTEFSTSLLRTIKLFAGGGIDIGVNWMVGLDVTANYNRAVEHLREQDEWFWILGDDHVFDEYLLLQLLWRDVDVIVPNCLERQAPFKPVVYSGIDGQDENGFDVYTVARLPQTGVHEVFAAGTAGMLIRRHVLDALEPPIFETSGRHQNEDLNLCAKIRDAGFKIHCDVDARLGHIGVFNIVPGWSNEAGRWGTTLHTGGQYISLTPVEPEEDS